MNDLTSRSTGFWWATCLTLISGVTLLALMVFTAIMVFQEYQARTSAYQEALSNNALSLANRLVRLSQELDSHILLRSENPSTTEIFSLLTEFSDLNLDLKPVMLLRPDMGDMSAKLLDQKLSAIGTKFNERNDMLAIKNNLDIAVRENVTIYQDDKPILQLIDGLSQAIAADNLILLGELMRQFNHDLRNSQIHAALASRFRQLAFGSRGVFPVSEDLIISNEQLSRLVMQTQVELNQVINRIQERPELNIPAMKSYLNFFNWQIISFLVLTFGLVVLVVYSATQWQKYLQNTHQLNRLESLRKISGEVAHDLNNMISVTISSLNMLKETASSHDNLRDRNLDKALFAADKSVSIIDRLLTFAKRSRLSPELCCVNELINGLYEVVCLTVGQDVEVKLDLCKDDTFLLIDPGQLESALINLCINAKNAIANTGYIQISTTVQRKHFLHITVSDNGCGIPRQVLPKVFEPFFTTDKSHNGMGLGLSTIYGFVKQSGGDVLISSTVGKGTIVTLTFKQ